MTTPKKNKEEVVEEQLPTSKTVEIDMRFELVSLDLIDDPERPMRSDMTPQSVEDLVMSIKQVGLIEPIVVKPKNGRYEVIAGHRRKYACEIAKIPEVPCYIRIANTEQTEMLKIHENLYRAEVKPSDEAEHFKYLIDKHKFTPIKVAQLISKSPSYVGDRLAIFNYPPFLREALDKKQISFSVAREFGRLDDLKTMSTYLYYAIRNGITQEGAHKWVQDYHRSKEQVQVTEQNSYDETSGEQVIEHLSECIYCKEPIKLLEAEVVYIHTPCRQSAMTPAVEQEIATN